MPLKKSTGNMYEWITHTWNPVKGECSFDCSYCYVKRWKTQPLIHLDESELRADLGNGNSIFVCSGCDLFGPYVPAEWIGKVRAHTLEHPSNKYLWHTKNPRRLVELIEPGLFDIACVTIESNRGYPSITRAPLPAERTTYLSRFEGQRMITVEPILCFDPDVFSDMILESDPMQVNIGADSGRNNLPEPSRIDIETLIELLAPYTKVVLKKNLRRILPGHRLYGGAHG